MKPISPFAAICRQFQTLRKNINRCTFSRTRLESLEPRLLLSATPTADSFTTPEDTSITLQGWTPVIALESDWSFLDDLTNGQNETPDENYPIDSNGNIWNTIDFNVNDPVVQEIGVWKYNDAPFETDGVSGLSKNTTLPGDAATHTTYLFRHVFDWTDDQPNLLRLKYIIDDGAVVYLNGTEIYRTENMPDGAITPNTFATDNGEESDFTHTFFQLPDGLQLNPTNNVLALEVHQKSLTSPDLGFDLELAVINDDAILGNDIFTATPTNDLSIILQNEDALNGTLNFNPDTLEIDYTPAPNFESTETFQYAIVSGGTQSAFVNVNMTFTHENTRPAGTDLQPDILAGTPGSILSRLLLSNDSYSDQDEDPVSVDLIQNQDLTDLQNIATITLDADSRLTITPNNAQHFGQYQFEYQLTDGTDFSVETQTVTVSWTLPFETHDDEYTIEEDRNTLVNETSPDNPQKRGVLLNDIFPEGIDTSDLTVKFHTIDLDGAISNQEDGSFVYFPEDEFSGTTSFQYTVINQFLESEPATVTIHVIAVNDIPDPNNDMYSFEGSQTIMADGIDLDGVIANDPEDPEGDPITAILVDNDNLTQLQSVGELIFNADGTFTFTPDSPSLIGTYYFNYQLHDGIDYSSPGQVRLIFTTPSNAPQTNSAFRTDDYYVLQGQSLHATTFSPDYLIQTHDDWAYLIPATYPDGWTDPDYDYSHWQVAPGAFESGGVTAIESIAQTVIHPGYDSSGQSNTALFIAKYQIDNLSDIGALLLDYVIDDGAIIYINGYEITRINMPENEEITPLTMSDGPGDEFQYHPFFIPESLARSILNQGENALAMEVHNNSLFADDFGVDMRLINYKNPAGVMYNDISTDAQAILVQDSHLANLQQYGTLDFNADGTFTYTPTDPNFTSELTFNYQLYDGINYSHPSPVTIHVQNINIPPTGKPDEFIGDLNGIIDTRPANNGIIIIDTGATWSYIDEINNGIDDGQPENYPLDANGLPYTHPDYDINTSDPTIGTWYQGASPFVAGGPINAFQGIQSITPMKGVWDSQSSSGSVTTFLFRHEFELSESVDTIQLEYVFDDGAIVYLNGQDIFRTDNLVYNGFPIDAQYYAQSVGIESFYTTTAPIDVSGIAQTGLNVLTVEVHQVSLNSSDAGMDLRVYDRTIRSGVLLNDPSFIEDNTLTAELIQDQHLTDLLNLGTLDFNVNGTFLFTAKSPDLSGEFPFYYRLFDGTVFSEPIEVLFSFGGMVIDVPGDFNDDQYTNALDIDLLSAAIRSNSGNLQFDVDEDGDVDSDDHRFYIEDLLGTIDGDANLDGKVNLEDLALLATHFGESNQGWGQGDFTIDGMVNLEDLARFATNFGHVTNGGVIDGTAGSDSNEDSSSTIIISTEAILLPGQPVAEDTSHHGWSHIHNLLDESPPATLL